MGPALDSLQTIEGKYDLAPSLFKGIEGVNRSFKGLGQGIRGLGFTGRDIGFRVQGKGYRVKDSGVEGLGLGPHH